VANFGDELVDLTQRGALHAVGPHLRSIEQQNAELRERLAREERRSLDQAIERAVPNWREIDRDPRWLQWLGGLDALSGRVRQDLLDEAIDQGNAMHVISFFRGFLREAGAAGHHGRPRQAAAGKPIYSRGQITHFANLRRKGAYTDEQWARWENELIAAGREGVSPAA
jgi:hypothetical protein